MTLEEFLQEKSHLGRPRIVCLCGSTRFMQDFQEANLRETLAGRMVLTVGCDTKSDRDLEAAGIHLDKEMLDALHKCKIDLADEILVLDVDRSIGPSTTYIGASTTSEIAYAREHGKGVRFLSEEESRHE